MNLLLCRLWLPVYVGGNNPLNTVGNLLERLAELLKDCCCHTEKELTVLLSSTCDLMPFVGLNIKCWGFHN